MARIRTIKPEFWTHPILGRLGDMAKWLAVALLNHADDEGFFAADPAVIRGAVAPYVDNVAHIHGALSECSRAGWIEVSEHPERGRIGRIVNFQVHQIVNRPSPSKLKRYWNSVSPRGVITESSLPEGNREQGTGRGKEQGGESEGNRVAAPTALPADAGEREAVTSESPTTRRRPRPTLGGDDSTRFDGWYATYPRKVAKGDAEKAWAALRPDDALTGIMVAAVQAQLSARESAGDRGEPSPPWKHPATWLRARCWEDDPSAVSHGPKKAPDYLDRMSAMDRAATRAAGDDHDDGRNAEDSGTNQGRIRRRVVRGENRGVGPRPIGDLFGELRSGARHLD